MTHQEDFNVYNDAVELLAENGFDGMAQAIEILMNEAMKLERSDVLQAAPYQRTDARRGYANGYKPKAVRSRLGSLELQVPQARGVEFYPRLSSAVSGANGHLNLPSPKCMSKAYQPAKSPPLRRNFAGWTSAARRSAARPRPWTKNSMPGGTDRWVKCRT